MIAKRIRACRAWLVFAAVALLCLPLAAQSLRPPNPRERAVLDHYRDVLREVLDKFGSDNWDEAVDYDFTDGLAVHDTPALPLDVDEMMQRTYTIRPGSPLFQKEVAPFAEKLQSMHDPVAMAALAKQMRMTRMSVEVHFNYGEAGVNPPPPGNPDLHIPGVAQAYRIANYKFDTGTSVVLLFGDWKTAEWRPGDKAYRFKFKHPARSAAIENIVVQLDGSPERIDELLKAIPWQRINDALTPAGQ